MNPQYMNQHPGGYNPGYGAPPSSQAQPGFGGPTQQGPPGQIGSGPPPQNMSNGPNQRPIGPPGTYGPAQGKARPPGPPMPNAGAPQMPMSNAGPPMSNAGPPMSNAGPPMSNAGPPMPGMGHPMQNTGPHMSNTGPPMSNTGPPMSNTGPPMSNTGPPMSNTGQPMMNTGQPTSSYVPPMSNGPHTGTQNGPPGPTSGFRGPTPQVAPGMARPPAPGPPGGGPLSRPPGPSGAPGPPISGPPAGPSLGPPSGPAGPPRPVGTNQMTNQMGAMNLGNQQFPRSAAPGNSTAPLQAGFGQFPPTSAQQPGPPHPSQHIPPSQPQPMPPSSQHMPGNPSQPQPMLSGYQIGMPPMTGASPMPDGMPGAAPHGPMGYNQGPPSGPPGMPGAPSSLPNQYGAPPVPGGLPPPPSPGGGFQGTYQGGQRTGLPNAGPMAAPSQPTQQPRRLDPDQMPSPIQVIEDDRRSRSGDFVATQRGAVPPLVTTTYTAEDRGNSNPRLIRSTMYNVPCSADMLKQSNLPFVLAISPFARLAENESPLPVVDLGQLGPVRCNRCKAYMNPYMQFVDGGRRFQCCFCGCHTDVPPEYFAHLDHTGRRVDSYDRPELCLGAYEFVATADYCKNNVLPKPPAFIFMIDVSYNAVKSGLVHLLCEHLKEEVLVNLPKEHGMEESEIRVGFVTYAKELHFYNVKGNLAQPQMLVVSDVQDVFVPLLDGFLVKLSESEAVIDTLLTQIPQTFAESRETEIVLGPVIQAGLDALKAAECTGKLYIFHTSLPIAEAPGKLKNRDDRKLLGTEKEKTILAPANNFYTKLGQECVAAGCGVDLFLFPNSYIDIASISEVPRLTGGNIYKYSYFQADLQGQRLMEDLKNNVMRPIAFDAIMRIRSSTGIRPVDFFGNFYMSNTTDVELANMDCEKTVTIEIKHDDKLTEAEGACIQAAILYTSISGQRRLRVVNMGYSCCTQMADLFRNCELDTLINYMAKLAIRESLNSNPKTVRENLMNRCAQILACYRKNCASPSSAGQLILPECMKLLPLYSNCIVKSHALQGASEGPTDDRSYLIHMVNGMSVASSQVFFYPRLLPLHELDLDGDDLPAAIRCSYERLKDNGIYLIDNGLCMLIWIGMNVSSDWVSSLFGVQSVAQIDIDMTTIQNLDNPISRRVRGVIQKIREERFGYLKLLIVRQRDKLEPVFQNYLAEDRSSSGGASYVDFLCHIHKEIRSLLS